jgi:hypothetical protein
MQLSHMLARWGHAEWTKDGTVLELNIHFMAYNCKYITDC